MVEELESTWRVYRKEWLHWRRFRDSDVAEAGLEAEFGGRLLDDDVRFVEDKYRAISGIVAVEIRRWNMVGQWKHHADATEQANGLEGALVVARNSREEHKLIQYGLLKLRVT